MNQQPWCCRPLRQKNNPRWEHFHQQNAQFVYSWSVVTVVKLFFLWLDFPQQSLFQKSSFPPHWLIGKTVVLLWWLFGRRGFFLAHQQIESTSGNLFLTVDACVLTLTVPRVRCRSGDEILRALWKFFLHQIVCSRAEFAGMARQGQIGMAS